MTSRSRDRELATRLAGLLQDFLAGRTPLAAVPKRLRQMANWVDEERPEPAKPELVTPDMQQIFEHWQRRMGKPKARFTSDRRSKVRARLKEGYPSGDVLRAIDNVASSEFHRGDNDRDQEYVDLTLICRSGAKLEQYRDMGGGSGPGPVSDKVERLREEAMQALKQGDEDAYNRANRALHEAIRDVGGRAGRHPGSGAGGAGAPRAAAAPGTPRAALVR